MKREEFHREYLNGILTAAVVNHSLNLPEKPVCPADFMPSMQQREETDSSSAEISKTPAEAVGDVRAFFRQLNALRDNRP